MRAQQSLPEQYVQVYALDLQKNKKTAILVNALAVGIAALLVVPMLFVVPITTLFDMEEGFGAYLLRFGVLAGGSVLYLVLHELVHGIAMKLCGTRRVHYGFTGMYAFAGSDDYYDKSGYIMIALAPIVVWDVVLAVLNLLVPTAWFWVVYLIQISNLSGAAGDLYVTVKFSRLPRDILVRDSGVAMTVYARCD
ncbi:MAG: DUF3267 domain-containing protein [Clostridia bacterium]|nr:DUF3267 domain-containing protein [Clostridia bacterium]